MGNEIKIDFSDFIEVLDTLEAEANDKNDKKNIYIVGFEDSESISIKFVCNTKSRALKRFHEIRENLLSAAELTESRMKRKKFNSSIIYKKMIKKLKEKDPDKIDNYPYTTPFIQKWEVDE